MEEINIILKSYIPTANMIAKTFGDNCEVVIHDLSTPKNSVIYVVNGSVTGRKAGQTFEHLIQEVLLNRNFHDDTTVNYMIETESGKKIKSSSALIRDNVNKVIGMLCINYDMTLTYDLQSYLTNFIPNNNEQHAISNEESFEEIMTIIDQLIDNILADLDLNNMNRQDNISVIKFMEKKGVFLVKGAIDKVADRMGISKVTIYSYLDEIKKMR